MLHPSPLRSTLVLAGASLVTLGLARFSYALVLPAMRTDLGLSYGRAGSLGTANTAGYLLGSLALPSAAARWRLVPVFRAGVTVTALAIIATGLTHAYPLLVVARALSGFAGAASFILGSAIAASLSAHRPGAVVLFNAAGGVGVVLAGLVLPALLAGHADRWPVAWFVLGAIGAMVTTAVLLTGWEPPSAAPVRVSMQRSLRERPTLHWLTVSYACFGAGYIVYVTFLVSTLRSRAAGPGLTSVAFVLLGTMTIVAPTLWRRQLAGWAPRRLMAGTLLVQAVGAAALVVGRSPAVMLMSVALFGSAFLLSPAIVTITVRQNRPSEAWATTIGAVTAVFAATQALAPWISGALIDRFGTSAGPAWTLVFSLLGAASALAVRA